jgi:hypothetical protein
MLEGGGHIIYYRLETLVLPNLLENQANSALNNMLHCPMTTLTAYHFPLDS